MFEFYISQLLLFLILSMFNVVGGEIDDYKSSKIYYLLDYKGIFDEIMEMQVVRNIWLYLLAIIWIPIVFMINMFFYLNALVFRLAFLLLFNKVTSKIFLKD